MKSFKGTNQERRSTSWYRALTLSERLISWRTSPVPQHPKANKQMAQARQKLSRWKDLPSFQQHDVWASRLAEDGVCEEDLLSLLAEPTEAMQERTQDPLPWVETLTQALFYRSETHLPTLTYRDVPPGDYRECYHHFLPLFRPLIHLSYDRLGAQIQKLCATDHLPALPFDPKGVSQLFLPLLSQRVVSLASRVLVWELHLAREQGRLHGDTPAARFRDFVQQYTQPEAILSMLERYPVLGRMIVRCMEHWQAVSLEVLTRLRDDWQDICKTFSSACAPRLLTEVQGEVGDSHRGGRSVFLLTFHSGFRLVYKPRSLAVDHHFQEIVTWVNEQGDLPHLLLPRILDRGAYGWSEFITAQECCSSVEVERFYLRLGAFGALLSTLAATDFHYDNLLAAGEHPMLLDLECLFSPTPPWVDSGPAHEALRTSVLTTWLLPHRRWSNNEHRGFDASGIKAAGDQIFPLPLLRWEHAGTDQMSLIRQYCLLPATQNRPRLQGQEVDCWQYHEHFLKGFTIMYHLLIRHRQIWLTELLPRFAYDQTRYLLRSTALYGRILEQCTHPDVVQDALDQDRYFDHLWGTTQAQPYLYQFIAAERADLVEGDIPLFWTFPGSYDLSSTQGTFPHIFEQTGLQTVYTRLRNLSAEDLARQLWIIRTALATTQMEGHSVAHRSLHDQSDVFPLFTTASSQDLQNAACEIGNRVCTLALSDGEEVGWLGLSLVNERDWKILPASVYDLYNGIPGITLFLAYLGKIAHKEQYTCLARVAAATIQRRVAKASSSRMANSVGVFQGKSALPYLFTHLSALWQDPELLVAAYRHAKILAPLIEQDKQLDIMAGSAGCIAALLALHTVAPSAEVLSLAERCGHHLIQKWGLVSDSVEKDMAQVSLRLRQRGLLTGFVHGAAGMAWSLHRLALVTGRAHFAHAATHLLEFERFFFSEKEQNWPDLSPPNQKVCDATSTSWSRPRWCNGATGIGLSRLAMLNERSDAWLDQEIICALQATLRQGFGYNHSLCHGDLGNVELLLTAQQRGLTQYNSHLQHLTTHLLTEGQTYGWATGVPGGIETPGLMTGLAGIGYQLLRLSAPATVPNLLLLAPPLSNLQCR